MTGDDDTAADVAECLADFHRRRALGEAVSPDAYRERLGAAWKDFLDVLEAEERLDAVLEPSVDGGDGEALPRAFGPYVLLRVLGTGGMGVVYEAVNRGLGRREAVKVLLGTVAADVTARERFRREARACAQVRHPCIVEIYDAGDHDGRLYYSMALHRGRSLERVVAEDGPMDARRAAAGLADIADALDALHRAGIVHRDVKPSNVLVDEAGRMVLTDFGIARIAAAAHMTLTGHPVGTPLYLSPEQIRGAQREIDGRSDVYGLGATLYEVLTGRPPFAGDDFPALFGRICGERPRSPCDVRPGVPDAAARIALMALEKRPDDRYPTAAAMRDDLRALAAGDAVAGRPVPAPVRVARSARRWIPGGIAAATLAAVGATLCSMRNGVLHVESCPAARVVVDGVAQGTTPLKLSIPSGDHEVRIDERGFAPHAKFVRLDPGERESVVFVLCVADPDDPEAVRRLLDDPVMPGGFGPAPSGQRTPPEQPPIRVAFPRGRVRVEDLRVANGVPGWRVDVSSAFEGEGRLELRRDGVALWSESFDPSGFITTGGFPDDVLGRLRASDTLQFGWFPARGSPEVAELSVVGSESAAALARYEERCREQPDAVRRLICASALRAERLPLAVWREAIQVTLARPRNEIAWTAALVALSELELVDSSPWREALEGLAGSRAGK